MFLEKFSVFCCNHFVFPPLFLQGGNWTVMDLFCNVVFTSKSYTDLPIVRLTVLSVISRSHCLTSKSHSELKRSTSD